MSSLLRLERKQKKLFKSIWNSHHFLSFSFGIETINTFTHSRSSFENHTRLQTKIGKIYKAFSHDVTAPILVFQNNETVAMLAYQDNSVGVEFFSYNKFA